MRGLWVSGDTEVPWRGEGFLLLGLWRSQRGLGVLLKGLWETEKLLVTEGISEVPEGVRDG